MSLRLRLILSYAALIGLLGLAAWWGVHRLTTDLTTALGESAASVGRSVVTVLRSADGATEQILGPQAAGGEADAMSGEAVAGETASGETVSGALAGMPREITLQRRVHTEVRGTALEHVRVTVDGRELSPEELANRPALQRGMLDVQLRNLRGEPAMLMLRGAGIERAIPLSNAGVDNALEGFSQKLGLGLLVLFGFGLLLSIWIAQYIARPLRALASSAQAVGAGALGTQATEQGAPEVRQTIAAFNRMSAQLQQLDAEASSLRADRELAELGEIGRGLAHSLRNPLHALGLSLEALAAQPADASHAQALAQAGREQLQRVDQALRGFLALSAGTGVVPQEVSLREVIDDVVLEATQRAAGRVAFVREGDDIALHAVPAELRVMLHAIVVNALEASPDGGCVLVALAPSDARDGVLVTVSDEGDGVPEGLRDRLFQPHVSGKPHGAGMGLFLAQRLAVLRYRGLLALQARLPRGTVATLRLFAREGAVVGDQARLGQS